MDKPNGFWRKVTPNSVSTVELGGGNSMHWGCFVASGTGTGGWNTEEGELPPNSSTSPQINIWKAKTWTQLDVPTGQRSQIHMKAG